VSGIRPEDPAAFTIDHVAIIVHDADVVAARFAETLGLVAEHDEILPDLGVRLLHLVPASAGSQDAPVTSVQLVQPVAEGPMASRLDAQGEGLHHICFAVGDVRAALAALPGEAATRVFTGARQRRACFLTQQIGGALIELVEAEPLPSTGGTGL
jgi:methylmalonyl-CoA/ethylmalonyl-CoA epimerase